MRKKHFGLCIFLASLVFGVCLDIVEAVEVRFGEATTITEYDFHEAGYTSETACSSPIADYWSQGNKARIAAAPYSGCERIMTYATVGVQIELDVSGYEWDEIKNVPMRITANFSYQMSGAFIGPCGHVHVYIRSLVENSWQTEDSIYLQSPGSDTRNNSNVTRTLETTVEDFLTSHYEEIYFRLIGDASNSWCGYSNSYEAEVTINSVKIEYLSGNSYLLWTK